MKLSAKTDKILKRILGTYIVVQILFTAGFAAHPPIGAIALTLVGRGATCGVAQSIQSFYRGWSLADLRTKAMQGVKLVRNEDGLQLTATPWGEIWEPETVGTAAVAQIAEIEAKYAGFPGHPIRKGDVVLDCGANIGVETLYALRLGAAKVVAIEPSPVNVKTLQKNFAKEIAEGRVIVYPKGVWDKDDVLELHLNDDTSAMDTFLLKREHSKNTVKVPLTTIDKLVEELKLERVDFIKMDTEGAEKPALRGGKNTIARFKPRLELSVDHLPEDPVEVPKLAQQLNSGYDVRCLLCVAEWGKWRVTSTILYLE